MDRTPGPRSTVTQRRLESSIPPTPDEDRRELTFGPEAAGERLDRALADLLPDHSRAEVARWIEDGLVLLDGAARPGKTRLRGGERASVRIPPPRPLTVEAEPIPVHVLHRDASLLVVDKPSGLTVHPGSGRPGGTLVNALAWLVDELPEATGADRPGIVHRLDKDTSGALVVALDERTQRALSALFADRQVEKAYVACVHGHVADDAGVIDRPIGRSRGNRKKMAVVEGGRRAVTRWTVLRRLPRHTWLRCEPVTGRTHQIRVHLRALGHPIVGDPLYGHPGAPGEDLAPRLMLHAWRIAFVHPATGERLEVEAPVPPDLEAALAALADLTPPRRRR